MTSRVCSLTPPARTWPLGGHEKSGDIYLFGKDVEGAYSEQDASIHLRASDAKVRVGGGGQDGDILILNAAKKAMIQVDGGTGDIVLHNADCAEEFDVDHPDIEPGTVLVLDDEPGKLRMSQDSYDSRVAGVVSGAGEYRPGIVLDRQPGRANRSPVALLGKVFCKVEAESAPVEAGTLLTTSDRPATPWRPGTAAAPSGRYSERHSHRWPPVPG
jgi:hypothetical protein